MNITLIVLTSNDSHKLECLLKQVSNLNSTVDKLAIDDFSIDSTKGLLEFYGFRVISNKFENFSKQRNFALQHSKTSWNFMLDSDEHMNDALINYINDFPSNITHASCLSIARKNYFLGGYLSSTFPDFQTRIINKDKVQYVGAVHERIEAQALRLDSNEYFIIHLQHDTIHTSLAKLNNYTQHDPRFKRRGKFFNLFLLLLNLLAFPILILINFFRFRRYRDGMPGFVWSIINELYILTGNIKSFVVEWQ